MRPTARGWTVLALVGFTVVMSWQYGPRSLDAVVIPLLVVVLASVATTVRADRPRTRRLPVTEGFIGESRPVRIDIETDSTVAATVSDGVGDGVTAANATVETTLDADGDDVFEYDLTLDTRGEHRVGPLSIVVQDVFGLFKRRFEYAETSSVLVYPRVHDLQHGANRDLEVFADLARRADRDEFDHLREYQRGDPLRDVHWKSAAKRPDDDLVVKEFAADETVGSVTVGAECTPGREDDLAAAAASVATYLLELDVEVGLSVSDDGLQPGTGRDHHRALLASLAVFEARELDDSDRADADVLVQADTNGTVVLVDGEEIPFDRLRGAGRKEGSLSDRLGEDETDGGPATGVVA